MHSLDVGHALWVWEGADVRLGIDLAILALPVNTKSLRVETLFDEELLLVVPAVHPLVSCEEISPRAIEAFPFVMLNEAHCLSENVAAYCRRQSIQPVTIERISQLTTVQELVALDHGVSIVPQMARRLDVSGRRVYRSFSGEKPLWSPVIRPPRSSWIDRPITDTCG